MKINSKLYDILKWVSMVFLPGAGTLYFALSSIWGLPYAEQVVGTITAIDTFLGVLLGISSATYYRDEASSLTEILKINEAVEKRKRTGTY